MLNESKLYKIPQFKSIKEFQLFVQSLNAAFITRKVALASIALFKRGASYRQIAKELELHSAESVVSLIKRYREKS